ncbi:hypothetical protein AB0H58_32355 [Nocardia neocaledoniensis]|uniref:hypothetical protein n=1 Tax=Nocardia neocaledoniensis TaxID=236511 RepID=UPI0033FACAA7
MLRRSHDKSRPREGRDPLPENFIDRFPQDEIERLNVAQIGSSWSLPLAPGASSKVQAWLGPRHWHYNVRRALADAERGKALLMRWHTSAEVVVEVAKSLARHAQSATGRHVTVSVATICEETGMGDSAVRRARRVLRDLGFAVEMATGRMLSGLEVAAAAAHHGGRQSRAASHWHLTVPETAVPLPTSPRRRSASMGKTTRAALAKAAHAHQGRDHLSLTSSVKKSSFVGKKSPTRASARACASTNRREEPRPLHLQRAAADLVAHCHGMDKGQWTRTDQGEYVRTEGSWHIGRVADAIAAAGINTKRWTGRDIRRRMDQELRDQGLMWPDVVNSPVAFLLLQLRRIDWSAPNPYSRPASWVAGYTSPVPRRVERPVAEATENAAYVAWRTEMDERHPHLRRAERQEPVQAPKKLPVVELPAARVARAEKAAREAEKRAAEARAAASRAAIGASVSEMLAAAAGASSCQAGNCSSAHGVLRTELPIPMPVCDPCWSRFGVEADDELMATSTCC